MNSATPEDTVLYVVSNLLKLFRQYVKFIFICAVISGGLGYGMAIYYSPPMQMDMTIQIGQYGSLGHYVPNSVDDMKRQEGFEELIPMFEALYFYGIAPGYRLIMTAEELYRVLATKTDHRRARRGFVALPYIVNMTNLEGNALIVSINADSNSQATKYLDDIFLYVKELHKSSYEKGVQALLDQKALVESLINQHLGQDSGRKVDSAETVLNRVELTRLLDWKYRVDRALNPANTYFTHQVGKTNLRLQKPNYLLFSVGGVIFGTVAGIFILVIYRMCKTINRFSKQ